MECVVPTRWIQHCIGCFPQKSSMLAMVQHCTGKIPKCIIVLEAPDNNEQKKILFNVVLILLRQHCKGKNLVCNVAQEFSNNIAQENILLSNDLILFTAWDKCCPGDSRQHCTGKKTQCNILGTTFGHFLVIFIFDQLIF